MVWSQYPIPARRHAERDDVANLDVRRIDDHTVDEQFHQRASQREGGMLQPLSDRGAEALGTGGQVLESLVLERRRRARSLFAGEGAEPFLQARAPRPQFVQREQLGLVGIQQPLDLPLQLHASMADVLDLRDTFVAAQPALPRALDRVIEHRRVAEQRTEV
jgi:hypothetical protein